jgi:hypothetical protein
MQALNFEFPKWTFDQKIDFFLIFKGWPMWIINPSLLRPFSVFLEANFYQKQEIPLVD